MLSRKILMWIIIVVVVLAGFMVLYPRFFPAEQSPGPGPLPGTPPVSPMPTPKLHDMNGSGEMDSSR